MKASILGSPLPKKVKLECLWDVDSILKVDYLQKWTNNLLHTNEPFIAYRFKITFYIFFLYLYCIGNIEITDFVKGNQMIGFNAYCFKCFSFRNVQKVTN
jgi:hypothetical protein